MTGRARRLLDAADRLDERVLGRNVPDERPLEERRRQPRPVVWPRTGLIAYRAVLLGLLAANASLPEPAGMFFAVGFFAAGVLVRRRMRGTREPCGDSGSSNRPGESGDADA